MVLINAIGVTQVSHICKMALYESSQPCCSGNDCVDSGCCADDMAALENDAAEANSCCTDVVKYFHQQSTTTIKENISLKSIQVWISMLITQSPFYDDDILVFQVNQDYITPARSGRSIIISVSSMLI